MRTLDDLLAEGVQDRFVLLRADFNVPLDGYSITDDGRIRAALPTITRLVGAGAKVLVMAHLGRDQGPRAAGPGQAVEPRRPSRRSLGQLLDQRVSLADDVVGQSARDVAAALTAGGVALLANVRCEPRETGSASERDALATELAELVPGGAFVSDGFGVVHREQASVYEIARKLPAYGGDLVARETEVLRRLTGDPARPYVVILGGSKVSDKLGVLKNLLPTVDTLLVGGAMCFTFLAAEGTTWAAPRSRPTRSTRARSCSRSTRTRWCSRSTSSRRASSPPTPRPAGGRVTEIPAGWMGLDVGRGDGPAVRREARPTPPRCSGTARWACSRWSRSRPAPRGVAEAVADSPAFSVIGGGDSASAIRAAGLDEERFGHISTGGGASLEFLEGEDLPGIAVLEEGA